MHPNLLHNGEIHATTEALLCPGQVGFLNGWGVFSTLRIADRVLFAFERHYRRMQRDAERIHIPFAFSMEELRRQLLLLVRANQVENGTLRVAVVRNRGGLFEAPGLTRDADLLAFTTDVNDWGAGVNLSYMPGARFGGSPFAGTKYTSWAENLTLNEMAHQRGFDEFILLNERGQVSECTSANIFIIQGSRVWTPPLDTSGCLPGVTRALLMEEIHVPGFTVAERELSPSEIEASDAVFITSTTRDLLPVLSVDGTPLARSPGPLAVLQSEFARLRRNYVAEHALKDSSFAA